MRVGPGREMLIFACRCTNIFVFAEPEPVTFERWIDWLNRQPEPIK
jgi:hypothetical protein